MNQETIATPITCQIDYRPSMFWSAPDDSYHTSDTVATTLELSASCLQHWRCVGGGPKFVRRGKIIFYRKVDVLYWLRSFEGPAETTSALSANDSQTAISIPQAA